MKIIDRKTFLALPPETLFSKYEPCCFRELQIKEETNGVDFDVQGIHDALECDGTEDFFDKLEDAKDEGLSLRMDFEVISRDGCFEESQLFAVWEQQDVIQLISRLSKCLD